MAKTLKDFLNERQLGPMVVKNPDEQKFIDKHVIAKVADRNGNDDELFKGSKVKFADRKKDRKGYNPGEDEEVYEELKGNQHKIDANKNGKVDAHDFKLLRKKKKVNEASYKEGETRMGSVGPITTDAERAERAKRYREKMKKESADYLETDLKKRKKNNDKAIEDMKKMGSPMKNPHFGEEAEQIDELSTPTLQSYRKKARAQGNAIVDKMKMGGGDWSKDQKDTKTLRKRAAGAQASGKQLVKRGESLKTEEVEQIDELSKKTLGSYAKKAKDQMSRSDTIAGREMGSRYDGQRPSPNERKHNQRADKRYRGLDMAISKLAKEEVELGEAMNSYDRYTSTHGDVMKMMKSIGDHLAAHKKAAISHSSPYDKKKGPHWGHVGDIDSIHSRLKDIHDQLAQQGEYSKMHEEIEDLQELSRALVGRYARRAKDEADYGNPLKSRAKGREMASRKRWGGSTSYVKAARVPATEEVDLEEKIDMKKASMGTVVKDFQKSDAPQFKGKSQKKRQVMAIAAKLSAERGGKPLNKEERLLANLGDISESHKRTLLDVFSKLNEDNQRKFMAACETPEGVEQMLDFAIQNRGE